MGQNVNENKAMTKVVIAISSFTSLYQPIANESQKTMQCPCQSTHPIYSSMYDWYICLSIINKNHMESPCFTSNGDCIHFGMC